MKNVLLLAVFAISFLWLPACKNQQKQAEKTTSKTQDMKQNNTYSLVVSFISIGQGVDQEAIEQFNRFITGFETENKVTLNIEKIPWGREGEVDYCIDLSQIDEKIAQKFLTKTNELLSNNNLIKVEKNAPCVHKR